MGSQENPLHWRVNILAFERNNLENLISNLKEFDICQNLKSWSVKNFKSFLIEYVNSAEFPIRIIKNWLIYNEFDKRFENLPPYYIRHVEFYKSEIPRRQFKSVYMLIHLFSCYWILRDIKLETKQEIIFNGMWMVYHLYILRK